jgi:uncharacterized flavoprotein (TIGR03862 family)
LFAAELLAAQGIGVALYDQMRAPGRKFLLAGRGGLNLTHSEPLARFVARYGAAAPWMRAALDRFPPEALMAWCEGLGESVFTGSSGRVFPSALKAAPLLRAWLRRLAGLGVEFRPQHCWRGWQQGALAFDTPAGPVCSAPAATLLALGGASWPRLGSDGFWVPCLRARGIAVSPLTASNCGVVVPWSGHFAGRFAGQPLKRVALRLGPRHVRGEAMITRDGLEGGCVYALSPEIRAALAQDGLAELFVDLRPDVDLSVLSAQLDGARQGRSLSNHLRALGRLSPAAIGLVQESVQLHGAPARLSLLVKSLRMAVTAMQPIGRAISSAGGIALDELSDELMLKKLPGVFAAGEMLDWEAPTGGYLLQGCFSTAALAAEGIRKTLAS